MPELAPDIEVAPEEDGVAGDGPLQGQSPTGDERPVQDGFAGDDTTSRPGLFARLTGR